MYVPTQINLQSLMIIMTLFSTNQVMQIFDNEKSTFKDPKQKFDIVMQPFLNQASIFNTNQCDEQRFVSSSLNQLMQIFDNQKNLYSKQITLGNRTVLLRVS